MMTAWPSGAPRRRAPRSRSSPAYPGRFFRPPYVGVRGWLGVFLDVSVDWDEVAAIVEDAYRVVAPKKLLARLSGTV